MAELILDTNVLLIAESNGHLSLSCQQSCIQIIESLLKRENTLVIDSAYHIIFEYEANIDTKKQNTFANRFLKWLYTNQANENLVKSVKIDFVSEFDFEQLTDEIRAIGIDKSDLKFVAVAISNNFKACIIQAADSKWLKWEEELSHARIKVEFPCRAELVEVLKKKVK